MRMKSLPKFGIKIIICYEDREWGEDIFFDLLELHESCSLLRYSQSLEQVEFIDGTIIQLAKPDPYSLCGQRADVVLAQGTIDRTILEEIVRPLANIGRAQCWVWHNEKWFHYEDLFPPKRNSVYEWLNNLRLFEEEYEEEEE